MRVKRRSCGLAVSCRVVSCLGVCDNNNMILDGCEALSLDDTELRLQS